MKKYIEKVNTLIEALPYIKKFNGKIFVIKYGGSAMTDEENKQAVMSDIVLMKLIGFKPVIVHGGGPAINQMLKKLGIESKFHNGLRVTDKETMDIVEMVLAGHVNKDIVKDIQDHQLKAVGICGIDADTIIAEKKILSDNFDLGYVGEITRVDTTLIKNLLNDDVIPIIAPVGKGINGESYNINADHAAAAIAEALNATKLIFLTDVQGVLTDLKDPSSLISSMNSKTAHQKIHDQSISGGMIPKVECCLSAVENGVEFVHIIDGRVKHSLLLELFTNKGIGTMFTK